MKWTQPSLYSIIIYETMKENNIVIEDKFLFLQSMATIKNSVEIGVQGKIYKSKNSVITSPDAISEVMNVPIKEGFAPMAIVENVPEEEKSFVELDYFINKCINLLKKKNGIRGPNLRDKIQWRG